MGNIQRVVVTASKISDVYLLAGALRAADREEVEALGFSVKRELRHNFRHAMLRNTVTVDGEIAGMWGCYGDALSDIGHPYFLTAAPVERIPVTLVKEGRLAVAEMLTIRSRLEGFVAASYRGACRFIETLGFKLHKPAPLGPHAALFRRYTMER